MFNRIQSFFRNLKVGRKLAYGFGAVVALTLIVGVVSYILGDLQQQSVADLQAERDQTALLHLMIEEVNAAEVDQHLFEENWQVQGYDFAYPLVISSKAHIAKALDAVAQAKESGADPEEVTKLTSMEKALQHYDQALDDNAAQIEAQGSLTTGLEGQMRAAAHDLETAIGLNSDDQVASFNTSTFDPTLLSAYLEMRRNEKDFQLRGNQSYVKATHDFNTILQNQISASKDLGLSQQAAMISQAKTYISVFDKQVENSGAISTSAKDINDTADSIDPTLNDLLTQQTSQEAQALKDYETTSATETVVQIVFVILAVVMAVLVSVAISRTITSQVNEINHLFRAAAIGNFEARARVLGHDELGQTAQGVNAMLEQLTSLIGTAAKAAQQRFSDVVTTMADWVWEIDAQGNYTYNSDRVFAATGYQPAELSGHNPVEFVAPADRSRAAAEMQDAATNNHPLSGMEVESIRKDGEPVILQISAIPVLDDAGNVLGLRGTGKDITEQKRAEQRIRENEATLRGIFDNMQDAFYRTDTRGHIVWASPSAAQMMGYNSVEEVIGLDTATDFWAHPEQRDTMLKALQDSGKVTDYEVEVRRKNGSTFPVSTSSSYYRNSEGQIAGVEGAFRDITQRRQTEQEIQSSARLLRSIIDATKDWIFLKDDHYRYMVVNEAFAYEYANMTPDGLIGKDDYDLGTPVHLIEGDPSRGIRGFRTDDRAVLQDHQTLTNPFDVVNFRDGTEHILYTIKTPLYNTQGEVIGVLGVSRDVTDSKRAEQQIEEQNKTLARTLEELRNLIAGVETAAGQVTGASGSLQSIVELIAGQAAASADMAARATGSAQEGGEAVSNTVSAMGRIRETTQETARRIKKLGEVSQEIGEVVRLIDEIADRVTVLALNASIQAAAAGDAGRGFAVVAEEVQRLAERATGATRQIENLIKGVQGEINEAMVSVEEVTQEVVGGSQLAQDAGDRMNDLGRVVSDLASLIAHLSQTTTRQTSQSLETLTTLAENLRESVAALRTPQEEVASGNGHGNGAHTTATL